MGVAMIVRDSPLIILIHVGMCVLKGLVSECFWFDIGYRNLKWFLVPN